MTTGIAGQTISPNWLTFLEGTDGYHVGKIGLKIQHVFS